MTESAGDDVVRLGSPDAAVEDFVKRLPGLIETAPVPIVAVGGPTAVGKSTLARRLATAARDRFDVRVLEGDRFLVPQARRPHPARFPDDVYETHRLRETVRRLSEQETVRVPFYERDGRHTGRLSLRPGDSPDAMPADLRARVDLRRTHPDTTIEVDPHSGDLLEVIDPAPCVWVFDSELSLYYDALLPLYTMSYGIRAPRLRRKAHFVHAVEAGERYPFLTRAEAEAKIEGFWETDDAVIEPTVARAMARIDLDDNGSGGGSGGTGSEFR